MAWRSWPVLVVALLAFSPTGVADWQRREADIMGTRISVELFHDDPALATQAIDAVMQEMHRIDATMSPYIASSDLARINQEAHRSAVNTSQELYDLIRRSLEFSELTRGAFDITFASAGFLYDYRKGTKPDAQKLQAATGLINYRDLLLNDEARSVGSATTVCASTWGVSRRDLP